jgi:hypothetical protein
VYCGDCQPHQQDNEQTNQSNSAADITVLMPLPCFAVLHLLLKQHQQDNGKPIFFSRAADVPLSFDHLRYFAG